MRLLPVVGWALAVSVLLGAVAPAPALAQTASEPAVTAAFLVNFARFTDWPADVLPADAPIVLCVMDSAVAAALTTATDGKQVGAHALTVMRVSSDPPPRQCSVLYASGLDVRRMTALAAALRGTSVLSVSDTEAFTKIGGVIHLFIEDGSMRFAVNLDAAERARLHLSSKLLTLARIVKEQP